MSDYTTKARELYAAVAAKLNVKFTPSDADITDLAVYQDYLDKVEEITNNTLPDGFMVYYLMSDLALILNSWQNPLEPLDPAQPHYFDTKQYISLVGLYHVSACRAARQWFIKRFKGQFAVPLYTVFSAVLEDWAAYHAAEEPDADLYAEPDWILWYVNEVDPLPEEQRHMFFRMVENNNDQPTQQMIDEFFKENKHAQTQEQGADVQGATGEGAGIGAANQS